MELDAPTESLGEEVEEERRILEAFTMNPKDGIGSLAEIEEMLKNNDTRLNYVLNGEAIENPFVGDREERIRCITEMICEQKTDGGYKCTVCDEESDDLDWMRLHILRHSDETVTLTPGPKFVKKYRSSDIPQPPQSRVPKEPQEPPTQEEHEEDHRCVFCGFASDRLDAVLFHTEQEHPTKRNVIGLLRLRLLRAAFDPKGYRLNNAELTRVNAISVSRFSG
ncbi:hypothetical protein TcWFU_008645 [Taenia crassiceps]|uniref:C2H2-type domain-containing protein n=1 Tax=Taenia crassiceps TaxID=6207 RepID=A0ABR4Q6J6_9CEST